MFEEQDQDRSEDGNLRIGRHLNPIMVRDYATSERSPRANQPNFGGGVANNSPYRRMLRDQAILELIERRDQTREEEEKGQRQDYERATDPALIR